jgi:Protein of unknown function (DUF4246)
VDDFKQFGSVRVFDHGVFKSDTVVDENLRNSLIKQVDPLERLPNKDWHPGSNGQVLDLVHPSLCPLAFGRSKILENGRTTLQNCIQRCGEGVLVPKPTMKDAEPQLFYHYSNAWSTKYQWLPCQVNMEGENAK